MFTRRGTVLPTKGKVIPFLSSLRQSFHHGKAREEQVKGEALRRGFAGISSTAFNCDSESKSLSLGLMTVSIQPVGREVSP